MNASALARPLKRLLPQAWFDRARAVWHRLRDEAGLWRALRYDHRRYRRAAGLFRPQHLPSALASLIKATHRIEKGLALRAPRPGFGRDAIDTALADAHTVLRLRGPQLGVAWLVSTLDEYRQFHQRLGQDVAWVVPAHEALRASLAAAHTPAAAAGTLEVTKEAIHGAAQLDLRAFFDSRYSVRQFSDEPVAPELIERAVAMAQKAPSVCNRQSGGVVVATAPATKRKLLALQNGNRGFGEEAAAVLLVTSRLDTFLSVGERYQGWIDGGLFAMSLIYALHSLGLGSCCLNWSVEPEADRALQRAAGLADDRLVIMMIAVGHLPQRLRVAHSPRLPLSDVLSFLDPR
jgi:nitroreductase